MKRLIWLLLISTGFAQTLSTLNGTTVGTSAGNISGWNGTTIGTSAGNIGAWNGLTSPGGGGGGTVTYVNAIEKDCASSTSCSTNSYTPSGAGHLLVGCVSFAAAVSVSSFGDGGTNTWTTFSNNPAGPSSANDTIYCYYAKNASASAITATATLSGSAGASIIIVEFSGANTTSPFVTSGKNTATGSTALTGAITTTGTTAMVITYIALGTGCNTSSLPSPGTWTQVLHQTGDYRCTFVATGVGAVSSQQYSINLGGSTTYTNMIGAFQ